MSHPWCCRQAARTACFILRCPLPRPHPHPRRRDLESARTLADQVRKREKLKKRELQLYKEEWAARMQGEPRGGGGGGLAAGSGSRPSPVAFARRPA